MPLLTFTPGDLIDGTSAPSAMSGGAMDSFAADITPSGWPTTGLVSSVEATLTATAVMSQNREAQIVVANPNPLAIVTGAVLPAAGVWSGAPGITAQYRTSTARGFALDKVGGWLTSYLTFSNASPSNNTLTALNVAFDGAFDVRFKIRIADWDAPSIRTVMSTANARTRQPEIHMQPLGLALRLSSSITLYAPWSSLGVTDGQWATFRVAYDTTNRARWWTSTDDGLTWTLAHSDPATGAPALGSTSTVYLRVGNGQAAAAPGMAGDMAWFEYRSGAGLEQTLSLDVMASASTNPWTPATGAAWTRGSLVGVTGATIPATITVRNDFETPFDPTTWRLIFDRQSGAYTIDEIVLDWAPPVTRGYRGIGLVRGSRG